MQDPFSIRYQRQLQLNGFGPAGQQKLKDAAVLVVGAGGLGVPVLQYLTGMGIGILGIVDDDTVGLSNLHRQVLYTAGDIGKLKVEAAAEKMTALNPDVQVNRYPVKLTPANALDIIRNYDLVIDATDNFGARYLINDACVILGKPFVYGAVHQYEGHISVFNFKGGPTYRCLYPSPPPASLIPDCNTIGVLGIVPGLTGCRQALEAVKIITGIGKILSASLLVCDFLAGTEYKIRLKSNPEHKKITTLQLCYESGGADNIRQLKVDELQQWYLDGRLFTLLDVREPNEFENVHIPQATNLPLSVLRNTIPVIDTAMPVVVYCRKGSRSTEAAGLLQAQYPGLQLSVLAGGMDSWAQQNIHL